MLAWCGVCIAVGMQLGSFFMGWVGVVFKKDIAMFSEHLAVGLSTGLMGSITTYGAMVLRNLVVMVTGSWITGFAGLLIGAYASCSLFGIQLLVFMKRRMLF